MGEDIRILAVDDDELTLIVLRKTLEAEHFVAHTASSAQDALAKLRENHYDAVLCDIWMPGMNGKAFYEYLEREFPGTQKKVIFMTADVAGEATWNFIDGQKLPYVMKPFNRALLLQRINDLVGRSPKIGQTSTLPTPPIPPPLEPDAWNGRERRGRRRIPVNTKVKVEAASPSETTIGTMIDASLRGASFLSERRFAIGSVLQISYPYPNVSSLPQAGLVTRSQEAKNGYWRISVEFRKLA